MNRETYPASQSPLKGDIDGPAGATEVTVVGLQHNPISPATPEDGDSLVFNAATGEWVQRADGNASITIGTYVTAGGQVVSRGITLSDDYAFLVNNVGLEALVMWAYGYTSQVFMNGTAILPT